MANPSSLKARLVFENQAYHVSHQLTEDGPTYLGSLLLQTKRHVTSLAELTDREGQQLGTLIRQTSRALNSCTPAAWTYAISFTEGYRHVHFIVTARYPNLPREYVRLAVDDWPEAPRGTLAEVEHLASRLRVTMGRPSNLAPYI